MNTAKDWGRFRCDFYRRIFSGFRHSWACVVVVEKVGIFLHSPVLVPSPEGSERKNPRDPRDSEPFFLIVFLSKLFF